MIKAHPQINSSATKGGFYNIIESVVMKVFQAHSILFPCPMAQTLCGGGVY